MFNFKKNFDLKRFKFLLNKINLFLSLFSYFDLKGAAINYI